jgi:hypothetical protein
MTQVPSPTAVRGKFDGKTLLLGNEPIHLEERDGEFWAEMVDPDWRYVQHLKEVAYRAGRLKAPPAQEPNPPRSRKRISLVTGSHFMQAYWVSSDYGNMLFSLPFTYLFEAERWVPRNDVFLFDPRQPFTHQVWNVNCGNCHATVSQPRQDAQTKVFDTRAAELGIACEACHGPAEEHARANLDPKRRYLLHRAQKPDPTISNPKRLDHVKSSETCGQCHAIRRNRHQDEWNAEGVGFRPGIDIEAKAPLVHYDGTDLHSAGNEQKRAIMEGSFWSDGQVRVSGREFNGLAASSCYTRGGMSCLSCHSMHRYQDTDDQLAPNMEGNQACLQCHGAFEAKLEQHTHHSPTSSGSLCYNCHMPHTTYGLLKAIRSHLINSPNAKSELDTGRPNACNLCHLDKSLGWTAAKLNEWYRQPQVVLSEEQTTTSSGVTWLLKGDAGQRALIAWHMGWAEARQTCGQTWMPRFLAELLVDPYAIVRYISQRSLRQLPGFEDFAYDYIGSPAQRALARQHALELWRANPGKDSETPRIRANAIFPEQKIAEALTQRNERSMELLE